MWLTWPLVALILGLVALFTFKRALDGLIHRISQLKVFGQSVSAVPEQISQSADTGPTKVQEIRDSVHSQVLKEWETSIGKQLQTDGVVKPEDQSKVLIRLLAHAQLCCRFERLSFFIFGSQLTILVNANSTPLTEEQIRNIYDLAVKNFPATYTNYSFEQYLDFLLKNSLVFKNDKNRFQVSDFGKEFMSHLVRSGLTHQRPN